MYVVCFSASTYVDFLNELKDAEQAQECRYAIFDVEYATKDGQPRNKIVFFMWFVLLR